MSLVIEGISGNQAEVDSGNNLKTTLPQSSDLAGYARILSTDGAGVDTTENGYLRVSSANPQFFDQVDGSVLNTNLYAPYMTGVGATIVQASGYWTLNGGLITTAGAGGLMISNKPIPLFGTLPMIVNITAKVLNLPQANATVRLGIGTASGVSTPTDGAYFVWTASGAFQAVINNGGVETAVTITPGIFTDTTAPDITMPPSTTNIHLYEIEIVEDHVLFSVDDVQVADVQVPAGQSYPFNGGHQYVLCQWINGTTPTIAPQISVGQVTVVQEDMNQNKSWDETLCGLGRGAYQSPITPFGQTANHANSTSPTSATLSNTAASYTTLGGRWQFAALSGAATDYALFAYQVPTGYQLVVKGITISSISIGAANSATVPTVLDWAIGVNSSAVSLATSDQLAATGTPGTWAPRRVPLSMQSFATSSLIGAQTNDIVRRFDAPLVVDSGRFLHIILQVPVGANTGSQVIRGTISIGGYHE